MMMTFFIIIIMIISSSVSTVVVVTLVNPFFNQRCMNLSLDGFCTKSEVAFIFTFIIIILMIIQQYTYSQQQVDFFPNSYKVQRIIFIITYRVTVFLLSLLLYTFKRNS